MEPQPYAAAMQRQMIREIEVLDPRFIVFVSVSTSWLLRPDSDLTVLGWFADYQTKFERVGVVDIVSPQRTTYVWGREAAAYTPRADAWLAIYERRPTAHAVDTGGH